METSAESRGEPSRRLSTAVQALREVAFWLERSRADGYRVRAYRRAADILEGVGAEKLATLAAEDGWKTLDGLGPSTAAPVAQAWAGRVPDRLLELRAASTQPLTTGGEQLLGRLRGDLHTHTNWSDGTVPLEQMAATAVRLGMDYLAITDHSPRLKVAHGLDADRLADQGLAIQSLQQGLIDHGADLRLLKGIEVDILADGRLDATEASLLGLDVVVSSVHSRLRDDLDTMTARMVAAVSDPRVTILGHCTGRLIAGERARREESNFDAEVVFEACRQFGVAVEINSRPERLDPPLRLLDFTRTS